MGHSKLYVKSKIITIFNEINKEKYHLEISRINDIKEKIENLGIIISDSRSDNVIFKTYSGNKLGSINVENKNSGYLIEYPSVTIDGKQEQICPVIKVLDFDDDTTFCRVLYHEVSHLFSSSRFKIHDGIICDHISGISLETYDLKHKKKFVKCDFNEIDCDYLNDYVASKLFEKLENKKYLDSSYKCIDFHNKLNYTLCNLCITDEEFIGNYFKNNVEYIIGIMSRVC